MWIQIQQRRKGLESGWRNFNIVYVHPWVIGLKAMGLYLVVLIDERLLIDRNKLGRHVMSS